MSDLCALPSCASVTEGKEERFVLMIIMIWFVSSALLFWLPGPRLDTERRFGLWLQQKGKNYACTGA